MGHTTSKVDRWMLWMFWAFLSFGPFVFWWSKT